MLWLGSVGLVIVRLLVELPAGPLPGDYPTHIVHTHLPLSANQ